MNDSDDTIIRNNCDGDVGIVAYSDWHCDIPLKFKLGGELEITDFFESIQFNCKRILRGAAVFCRLRFFKASSLFKCGRV